MPFNAPEPTKKNRRKLNQENLSLQTPGEQKPSEILHTTTHPVATKEVLGGEAAILAPY